MARTSSDSRVGGGVPRLRTLVVGRRRSRVPIDATANHPHMLLPVEVLRLGLGPTDVRRAQALHFAKTMAFPVLARRCRAEPSDRVFLLRLWLRYLFLPCSGTMSMI